MVAVGVVVVGSCWLLVVGWLGWVGWLLCFAFIHVLDGVTLYIVAS